MIYLYLFGTCFHFIYVFMIIQNNLGTAGQSREKLQLFLSDNDFYNTVQGVIFGDSKHPVNDHNNNVSLTIYYKTYTK